MSTATVKSKGQITIPEDSETVDLMSLYGSVKPAVKGVTLADMEDAIRREATEVPELIEP